MVLLFAAKPFSERLFLHHCEFSNRKIAIVSALTSLLIQLVKLNLESALCRHNWPRHYFGFFSWTSCFSSFYFQVSPLIDSFSLFLVLMTLLLSQKRSRGMSFHEINFSVVNNFCLKSHCLLPKSRWWIFYLMKNKTTA